MLKTLFETALTDVSTEDIEGVGSLRYDEKGKVYRWVKNEATSALTAKQPVCYDVSDVGTKALYETVLTPAAADLMCAAGIVLTGIGKSGGTTGCFGWVQVQGYCQDALVATPNTVAGGITSALLVGSEVICVDGKTALAHSDEPGNAPVYSSHFIALETLAAATPAVSTAIDVMVRCL